MKKQAYQLLFLLLVSVTSYAQKKGKLALPQIEITANNSPWENCSMKQLLWSQAIVKNKIDSTVTTSLVITSTEKTFNKSKQATTEL